MDMAGPPARIIDPATTGPPAHGDPSAPGPPVIGAVGLPTGTSGAGRRAVRCQGAVRPTRERHRRAEGEIAAAQRNSSRSSRGDPADGRRAQGHHADLAAVKVKITTCRPRSPRQDAVQDLVRQPHQPRTRLSRSSRPRKVPRSSELAERKAPPGPACPRRLRHRSDLAARDLPVGRDVHRPADRDELLHRRRRAGQGPRRADRQDQETLAAMHQTVVDTQARTDELRVETAAQKRALDKSLLELKAAKAQLKKLETQTAKALASRRRDYAAARRATRRPPRRRWPRPPRPRRSSRTRSTS